MHGQRGGVDDPVGDLAQVGEGLALGPDPVDHGALAGQRMTPPRPAIAAHQPLAPGAPRVRPPGVPWEASREMRSARGPRVRSSSMVSTMLARYSPSRTSTPRAMAWMPRLECAHSSANVGIRVVGRLSTQK